MLCECSITCACTGFRSKEYNKVEDLYDTRIPLHNEEAFQHGLRFKAKVSPPFSPDLPFLHSTFVLPCSTRHHGHPGFCCDTARRDFAELLGS